jgi:hypothetical protein
LGVGVDVPVVELVRQAELGERDGLPGAGRAGDDQTPAGADRVPVQHDQAAARGDGVADRGGGHHHQAGVMVDAKIVQLQADFLGQLGVCSR